MNFTDVLGRLLGLPQLGSVEQYDWQFEAAWAQQHPMLLLVGCLALVALTVRFYRRYQAIKSPLWRFTLPLFRSLLLCLLLVVLAEPTLTLHIVRQARPLLCVLFDGSQSMSIVDHLEEQQRRALDASLGRREPSSTPVKRIDDVRALVDQADKNVFRELNKRFRLRAFSFDRPDALRALPLGPDDETQLDTARLADQLRSDGTVTGLGGALTELLQQHGTRQLAGVVVVSDFDQNAGPPALGAVRELGVPVHTIGVGPDKALDIAVDLQAPPLMKKGENSALTVSLRRTGYEDRQVELRIVARPLESGGASVDSTLVRRMVSLRDELTLIEIPHTPNETGRFAFAAEVAPLDGEVVTDNNRAEREVNIRDDFLRLLFVENEPTWEWRFVKEVFHRDPLVGVNGFRTFLRSADPKVRQLNALFLPTLAAQRKEFFANDVIFLGDLPANSLSKRFCDWVEEFVSDFGGGLVVITGPNHGGHAIATSPLADLLPIVYADGPGVSDAKPFTPRLTTLAGQYPFMQIGEGSQSPTQAWSNLGPLPWYQRAARVRPNATVLLEHPTDKCDDGKTPEPLIAVRRYGRGEVVYVAFNEMWRLRRKHGELYYRQFWGQMIHHLGLSHALGEQKRFVVRTDRQRYQVDDAVQITIEAYDENYSPLVAKLANRQLQAELIPPAPEGAAPALDTAHPLNTPTKGGEPLSIAASRDALFETQVKALAPGTYRLRVRDPIADQFIETSFVVAHRSVEQRSAVRNTLLQDQIAQASGGKSLALADAHRLNDELSAVAQQETNIRILPLWNTWLVFSLVVGLMVVEWGVRKWINLP